MNLYLLSSFCYRHIFCSCWGRGWFWLYHIELSWIITWNQSIIKPALLVHGHVYKQILWYLGRGLGVEANCTKSMCIDYWLQASAASTKAYGWEIKKDLAFPYIHVHVYCGLRSCVSVLRATKRVPMNLKVPCVVLKIDSCNWYLLVLSTVVYEYSHLAWALISFLDVNSVEVQGRDQWKCMHTHTTCTCLVPPLSSVLFVFPIILVVIFVC